MNGTATIIEWNLDTRGPVKPGVSLTVDFDPKSLVLNYTTTGSTEGADKTAAGTWNKAPPQQTGQSTTLAFDLIFDNSTTGQSVEGKTSQLVALTLPNNVGEKPSRRVIRFSWGSFVFYGYVDSMTQTIDYFSATGTPLRATVHLGLNQVNPPDPSETTSPGGPSGPGTAAPSFGANAGIGPGTSASGAVGFGANASAAAALGAAVAGSAGLSAALSGASVGTTPLTFSQAGDTIQAIAARAATGVSWQAIAAANDIDNPRLIAPGTVLDTSAGFGSG